MAINADLGQVLFDLRQQTVNHARYQEFMNGLINFEAAHRFNGAMFIVQDGARPHLNTDVPKQHGNRFQIRTLPPYSPFLNPVEQAHSCFKAAIGRQLTTTAVQNELPDDTARQALSLTQTAWRARILLHIVNSAMGEITQPKCSHWCRRVDRFLPASLAHADIEGRDICTSI